MKNVKNTLLEEKDSSLENVKGFIKENNGKKLWKIKNLTRQINNLNLTAKSDSANLLKLQNTGAEVKSTLLGEEHSSLENEKGLIKKQNRKQRKKIQKLTWKINGLNLTAKSDSANLSKLQQTAAEVKSTLLGEKHSLLENEKGLIKKQNGKQRKKINNITRKINVLNLTAKSDCANLLKKLQNTGADAIKNNKKNKPAKQEGSKESNKEPENVNDKIKSKKHKTLKVNYEESELVKIPSTEQTESQLLINNQYKEQQSTQNLNKKRQKKSKKNNYQNKSAAVAANSVQKTKISDSEATKNAGISSSKVLTKKEKKAQKRQSIKDRKLSEKQTRGSTVDDATVFVGNLPVNSNRKRLSLLFQKFGPISGHIRLRTAGGKVIFSHKQRINAGSLNAYVVLKDKETAEKALSLHGTDHKGHQLRVTLASNNSLSQNEEKRTVFVGNLKYSATEESLREIFSNCGEIDYVRCIRDGDIGCKGVAYVCFKRADAVGLALELNKTIMDDRPLNVERFSTKKLGAKKAREAQEVDNCYKKGVKQRLDVKKGKNQKIGYKKENRVGIDATKKSKKSEFRGVKVEGLKKKQKSKKKKSRDQMLQLAKKIAPKAKTQ